MDAAAAKWIGLGGRALIVSGIFGVTASLLHPEGETSDAFVAPNWTAAHVIEIGWIALLLFGLVGLYTAQATQMGKLGFVATIAAFLGSSLLIGVVTVALTLPVLAVADPNLVAREGPLFSDPAITAIFATTLIAFLFGFVGLGIAIARAGALPALAGVGLSLGAFLHAGGEFGLPWPLVVAGGVVFSAASVWLGWSLARIGEQPQAAPAIA